MAPKGCFETSPNQSTLRKMSEERRSNLHRGWNLQSLRTYSSSHSVSHSVNPVIHEAGSTRSSTALVTIFEQFVPPVILNKMVVLKLSLQTTGCIIFNQMNKEVPGNMFPNSNTVQTMGDVLFARFKESHLSGAVLIQQTARCTAPSVIQHAVHQIISPHCQRLNQTFSWQWIGCGAPLNLPVWSPEIHPLDVYLWERLQPLVYSEPIHNLEAYKQRVLEWLLGDKNETTNLT